MEMQSLVCPKCRGTLVNQELVIGSPSFNERRCNSCGFAADDRTQSSRRDWESFNPLVSYSDIQERAIVFATKAHAGQRRKGNAAPLYIKHPLEVWTMLLHWGCTDESWLVAAILHDVVEDTPRTLGDIEENFTQGIASIVRALTHHPQQESKESYLQRLAEEKAEAAQAIKFADRICNVQDYRRDGRGEYAKTYMGKFVPFLKSTQPKFWSNRVYRNGWYAAVDLAVELGHEFEICC